ncbi:MAG: hypothetical protein ARM1_0669 [Candidatus Micrarchaeota archaeon]|nr:MAG: hypothetical protein ARM1_0669 [Candidatus Micrarchaeota archaeon]
MKISDGSNQEKQNSNEDIVTSIEEYVPVAVDKEGYITRLEKPNPQDKPKKREINIQTKPIIIIILIIMLAAVIMLIKSHIHISKASDKVANSIAPLKSDNISGIINSVRSYNTTELYSGYIDINGSRYNLYINYINRSIVGISLYNNSYIGSEAIAYSNNTPYICYRSYYTNSYMNSYCYRYIKGLRYYGLLEDVVNIFNGSVDLNSSCSYNISKPIALYIQGSSIYERYAFINLRVSCNNGFVYINGSLNSSGDSYSLHGELRYIANASYNTTYQIMQFRGVDNYTYNYAAYGCLEYNGSICNITDISYDNGSYNIVLDMPIRVTGSKYIGNVELICNGNSYPLAYNNGYLYKSNMSYGTTIVADSSYKIDAICNYSYSNVYNIGLVYTNDSNDVSYIDLAKVLLAGYTQNSKDCYSNRYFKTDAPCINGLPEYVASFNGLSSENIQVKPSSSLDSIYSNNKITVSAWIYQKQSNECEIAFVDSIPFYRFGVSGSWSPNRVMLELWNTGLSQTNLFSSSTVPYNKWVNIVATYNGSYVSFYIDGVPAGSYQYNQQIDMSNGSITYLGANPDSACDSGFSGYIANIQLYNSSLSRQQIKQLYLEGISGAPVDKGSLVAWWPLDGSPNDYSGNENNGVAYNVSYSNNWEFNYIPPNSSS